jgi:hypothetical protein
MNHQTDEALIREVRADRTASPREKEMARRLLRLLFTLDEFEEIIFGEFVEYLGRTH